MENKALNTGLTIGSFAIGVIGLVIGIMIMLGNEGVIGFAITLSMILMAVAAGVAVIFGIIQLAGNFKKNIPFILGAIGFLILAAICYSMASGELMPTYEDTITEGTTKLSGAGLLLTYVLIIAALITSVAGEVLKIFK